MNGMMQVDKDQVTKKMSELDSVRGTTREGKGIPILWKYDVVSVGRIGGKTCSQQEQFEHTCEKCCAVK